MDLESIIKKYVHLSPHHSKRGWHPIVCKVCNDHNRKGPRAAFIFDNGSVGYNCFNDPKCNASYKASQTEPLSKAMERLLQAYNIPESEYEWINVEILQRKDCGSDSPPTLIKKQTINTVPPILEMPRFFKKMSEVDPDDIWRIVAEDYLVTKRKIDPASYPFYLSYKDEVFPHWKKWYGRLIYPIYDQNNNLIFYQGRDLVDSKTQKYMSPNDSKDLVMYGYNQLYKNITEPLYIVEGFFDAFHIDGVAVFGNKLSEGQLINLRRCRRPKVIIPDRTGKGYELALQGLAEGWSISTPDISNCKDIGDAITRFGKLYTLKTIAESVSDGFAADLALRMYCSDFQ